MNAAVRVREVAIRPKDGMEILNPFELEILKNRTCFYGDSG
jgi:hypothetical protein